MKTSAIKLPSMMKFARQMETKGYKPLETPFLFAHGYARAAVIADRRRRAKAAKKGAKTVAAARWEVQWLDPVTKKWFSYGVDNEEKSRRTYELWDKDPNRLVRIAPNGRRTVVEQKPGEP